MPEQAIVIFGWFAAGLTTISMVPQAISAIRTKNTSGISLLMYILFVLGVICWMVYGFARNDAVIWGANVVTFVFASVTLTIKIINVASGRESFLTIGKKGE